jgi:hypothetical protein
VNSWATVCLWRRVFQLEDEKEENEKESIHETTHRVDGALVAGDNVDGWTRSETDPVSSHWARRELMEFRRSTSSSQNLRRSDQPYFQPQSAPSDRRALPVTPSTSLDHPDLRVSGMFLPQ